mgnify:CR=1 FL=1
MRISCFSQMLLLAVLSIFVACTSKNKVKLPEEILGNPNYQAISYGGYRNVDRSKAPSVEEIMEDLQLLQALGIKVIRTYHARLYDHAPRVLEAIHRLKRQDSNFEMYVMLGCWMQCEGAWTDAPNHSKGDSANNRAEIDQAIALAQQYPNIVRVIAVGNEAMVHWAATYYVEPQIILAGVERLQKAKEQALISQDIWITSSDNFASWGGEQAYQGPVLERLIKAVDYLSVHSYPFHDTHYNPAFWYVPQEEESLPKEEQIKRAIDRCVNRVDQQVGAVQEYLKSLEVNKPIHIGETGWASADNSLYGAEGSHAADPYKQFLYHEAIRAWSESKGMSCFYFEGFDEPWKDGANPGGSENHFGIFTVNGQAKFVLHQNLEKGVFNGLGRNGQAVKPAGSVSLEAQIEKSLAPTLASEQLITRLNYKKSFSGDSAVGLKVLPLQSAGKKWLLPRQSVDLQPWEGSCSMEYQPLDSVVLVVPKRSNWWGGAFQLVDENQDLSHWNQGYLTIEYKANFDEAFTFGLLSGDFTAGTQKRAAKVLAPLGPKNSNTNWKKAKIALRLYTDSLDFTNVSSLLFVEGKQAQPGDSLWVRSIAYTP